MKTVIQIILSLFIFSFMSMLTGCSSKKEQLPIIKTHIMETDIAEGYVEETEEGYVIPHKYAQLGSSDYGLVEDKEVDARMKEAEKLSANSENEIDSNFVLEDPSWTTKLVLDPDAFTADKFEKKEPVVTYKYDFDSKFYKEARWRSANE